MWRERLAAHLYAMGYIYTATDCRLGRVSVMISTRNYAVDEGMLDLYVLADHALEERVVYDA